MSLNDSGSLSLTEESLIYGEACNGKSVKQNKQAPPPRKMKLSNPIYFTKIKDPLQKPFLNKHHILTELPSLGWT